MALVVFLHGLETTPQMWQDALSIVPPGTTMQAPWMKGLRPGKEDLFSRQGAAAEVLGLLNQHGAESMTLVGYSLGAAVAVTAAKSAPEVIDRLVLISPPPKVSPIFAKAQIAALKAASPAAIRAKGIDRVGTIAFLTALNGFDTVAEAQKLAVPTLIANEWGAETLSRAQAFLAD